MSNGQIALLIFYTLIAIPPAVIVMLLLKGFIWACTTDLSKLAD